MFCLQPCPGGGAESGTPLTGESGAGYLNPTVNQPIALAVFVCLILLEIALFVGLMIYSDRLLVRVGNALVIGLGFATLRNALFGGWESQEAMNLAAIHGATLVGLAVFITFVQLVFRWIKAKRNSRAAKPGRYLRRTARANHSNNGLNCTTGGTGAHVNAVVSSVSVYFSMPFKP